MPQASQTRRRWFQFSLATMLVIVTLLSGFLAYHANWIRQRREVIRKVELNYDNSHASPPGLLWMFNEQGYKSLCLRFGPTLGRPLSSVEDAEISRVQRLFPESVVVAGWMPSEDDRMVGIARINKRWEIDDSAFLQVLADNMIMFDAPGNLKRYELCVYSTERDKAIRLLKEFAREHPLVFQLLPETND
jgi:hypothetical protein